MTYVRLQGRPKLGDWIEFSWWTEDLRVYTLTGLVEVCTGEASRVKVDTPKGDFIPDYVIVPHVQAKRIREDRGSVRDLLDAIGLISAQDQGCGGTMTEAECWRAAQRIALETLAEYGQQ